MRQRQIGPAAAGLAAGRLAGTWRLVSFETRYPDGKVARPFGRRPQGLLLYTPDGGMSASIAAGGRRPLPVANPRDAPAAQKARLFDSFLAYAGRYSVRGSKVRHRVIVASNPALAGTVQVRDARLAQDRLELSAVDNIRSRGGTRRHVIVWARKRR